MTRPYDAALTTGAVNEATGAAVLTAGAVITGVVVILAAIP